MLRTTTGVPSIHKRTSSRRVRSAYSHHTPELNKSQTRMSFTGIIPHNRISSDHPLSWPSCKCIFAMGHHLIICRARDTRSASSTRQRPASRSLKSESKSKKTLLIRQLSSCTPRRIRARRSARRTATGPQKKCYQRERSRVT